MKPSRLPLWVAILLFVLVAAVFVLSASSSFKEARAAYLQSILAAEESEAVAELTEEAFHTELIHTPPPPMLTPLPGALMTPPVATATLLPTMPPTPTRTPSPTPIPNPGYADTNGILAMGIMLVVVILTGMVWAGRSLPGKKTGKPS